MRVRSLFLLILAWVVIPVPAFADLTATLDRKQTSLDNPVRLTIVSDQQQAADQLDISALERDFQIIGQSRRSQISMRNGAVSTEAHILLDLLPRREGELAVPALTLGNEQTAPLVLTVSAAGSGSTLSQPDEHAPDVLIEAQWENPGRAYVQSQLNLIIRIYHRGNLLEAALDEPRPLDTLVKRIGNDLQGGSTKDGVEYQTIERRYALFPQKSGTLTIPPVALQTRVQNTDRRNNQTFAYDPFSRGRRLSISSHPLSIEIAPPAADFVGRTWLPSDRVTLSRSGLPEAPVNLGDAINLKIDLSALGLSGTQLPEVLISDSNKQFKLYPDQPSFADSTSDGKTIEGTRSQTFVLIASVAGSLEIPELTVAWWDRKNDRQQYARLPAATIEVNASEPVPGDITLEATPMEVEALRSHNGDALTPKKTNPPDGVNIAWKWLSLASLSGWLLSTLYFLHMRRSRQEVPVTSTGYVQSTDLRPLLNQIKKVAGRNEAQATWRALQAYARARWPDQPPQTPENWAERLEHPKIGTVIAELDSHLFNHQQGADWNGEGVAKIVLPELARSRTHETPSPADTVPAMYPYP